MDVHDAGPSTEGWLTIAGHSPTAPWKMPTISATPPRVARRQHLVPGGWPHCRDPPGGGAVGTWAQAAGHRQAPAHAIDHLGGVQPGRQDAGLVEPGRLDPAAPSDRRLIRPSPLRLSHREGRVALSR